MSDFDCLHLSISDTVKYFSLAVYDKGRKFIYDNVYSILSGICIYSFLLWLMPCTINNMLYWIILGILSSVGLGSGLHTFVLYLAPHIVNTTMENNAENALQIYFKVMMPALYWGIGTAIGELPPYLLAKGASYDYKNVPSVLTANPALSNMLKRYGFFTILAFASIPNPLFDLAGIISGYVQIPFSTFFSSVLIGKAFIKAQGQTLFVIYTAKFVKTNYLTSDSHNWMIYYLSFVWQILLFCLFTYFILTIVKKIAKNYLVELLTKKKEF